MGNSWGGVASIGTAGHGGNMPKVPMGLYQGRKCQAQGLALRIPNIQAQALYHGASGADAQLRLLLDLQFSRCRAHRANTFAQGGEGQDATVRGQQLGCAAGVAVVLGTVEAGLPERCQFGLVQTLPVRAVGQAYLYIGIRIEGGCRYTGT